MSAHFKETERLFSRPAFLALAGILIATEAFIIACACFGLGLKTWAIAVTAVVFTAVIAAAWWLRISICVADGIFSVRLIRRLNVPLADVLDHRTGDVDIIKNYSGLGLKKVKYHTYVCPGYETALSFKTKGLVVTVTTAHADVLAALFPPPRTAEKV